MNEFHSVMNDCNNLIKECNSKWVLHFIVMDTPV